MPIATKSVIGRRDVATLIESRSAPCVSVYLPTVRVGREVAAGAVRLKNLLREAGQRLRENGSRGGDAEMLLAPSHALVDDRRFWTHTLEGLALFSSPDLEQGFRLPVHFPELVEVGSRFHLKPLLPLLAADGRFYVLAISENAVRLLEGTRQAVAEVEPEGMPEDLASALWVDDPEKTLQFHSRTPQRPGGRRDAMFHGHGAHKDAEKTNLLRYFQRVDRALMAFLGEDRAPLVLAGVDYYFPIYREASRYPHIVAAGIAGNPEAQSPADLHAKAWALVEPLFRADQEQALARYRGFAGTGYTSADLADVLVRARQGRVDTIFVGRDAQRWGTFPEDGDAPEIHGERAPGDTDLVDLAVCESLRRSGTAYVLDRAQVPEGRDAVAILRKG